MFASPGVKQNQGFDTGVFTALVYYTTFLFLKWFTQGKEALVPPTVTLTEAGCTFLASLRTQRMSTAKKKFIREQTAKLVSPYLQHLLSVLPVSMPDTRSKYTLCNTDTRLLCSLPHWAIKWSFITKLPACHKTRWLLFWNKRVLQGLSCKMNWANICSYSV